MAVLPPEVLVLLKNIPEYAETERKLDQIVLIRANHARSVSQLVAQLERMQQELSTKQEESELLAEEQERLDRLRIHIATNTMRRWQDALTLVPGDNSHKAQSGVGDNEGSEAVQRSASQTIGDEVEAGEVDRHEHGDDVGDVAAGSARRISSPAARRVSTRNATPKGAYTAAGFPEEDYKDKDRSYPGRPTPKGKLRQQPAENHSAQATRDTVYTPGSRVQDATPSRTHGDDRDIKVSRKTHDARNTLRSSSSSFDGIPEDLRAAIRHQEQIRRSMKLEMSRTANITDMSAGKGRTPDIRRQSEVLVAAPAAPTSWHTSTAGSKRALPASRPDDAKSESGKRHSTVDIRKTHEVPKPQQSMPAQNKCASRTQSVRLEDAVSAQAFEDSMSAHDRSQEFSRHQQMSDQGHAALSGYSLERAQKSARKPRHEDVIAPDTIIPKASVEMMAKVAQSQASGAKTRQSSQQSMHHTSAAKPPGAPIVPKMMKNTASPQAQPGLAMGTQSSKGRRGRSGSAGSGEHDGGAGS